MAKFSNVLLNKLTEFLVCEIDEKVLGGVTYTMVLKDEKGKAVYDRCKDIKKEAVKCGYGNDEVFRIYEVQNGFIFDMDLSVARKITMELAKAVDKMNEGKTNSLDLIGDSPSKRRKEDMARLAKYVREEYDNGNTEVDVALFSRNSVPRIIITGKGPDGKMASIKYSSYAIRHWDIEKINSGLLIPSGIRVSKLEPKEVLPSKTGCRFTLHLESI